MRNIVFIFILSINVLNASDLKWNCGKLNLKWNEVPNTPGKQFSVEGCWQDQTYFLLSLDCQKNPKSCLNKGEGNELAHPGGKIGSPDFVLCYRSGGRPRFLQVKINNKWEDTHTCFFKSEQSFMDYETLAKLKKP